jgi:endonuclease/exonuclease/phosphatase family metal-dependent hydrolase
MLHIQTRGPWTPFTARCASFPGISTCSPSLQRSRGSGNAAKMQAERYDILVFQEAFLADARRIIRRELRDVFPYEYGPANRKFSVKTNSGIWVLSKLPMQELEEIDFTECAGFDDCFARKGALLLQGEMRGVPFQLLGTHLQAGGPQAIRHGQFAELRTLLDRHQKPQVPQIIAGDFNTGDTDTAQYRDMLATLDATDGPLHVRVAANAEGYPNDLHSDGFRSFRIIDYVFYRGNGLQANISRDYVQFQAPWSRKHQDLSDHFGIGATVYW